MAANCRTAVANRVEIDKEKGADIARTLNEEGIAGRTVEDEHIRKFFPEVFNNALYQRRQLSPNNLPRGAKLSHYLLLGRQTLVNLAPMSEAAFKKEHGISIHTCKELATAGFIVPNIYVRNPEDWKDVGPHMLPLLEHEYAIVTGERVDAYMTLRDDKYPEYVESCQRSVSDLMNYVGDAREVAAAVEGAQVGSHQDLAKVTGIRWAYLKIVHPAADEVATEAFRWGALSQLTSVILVAKHIAASHITWPVGDEYVWGPHDLEQLKTQKSVLGPLTGVPGQQGMQDFVYEQNALEYILERVRNIAPINAPLDLGEEKLVDFLARTDLDTLRAKIPKVTKQITALARNRDIDPDSLIDEFSDMRDEYSDALEACMDYTKGAATGGLIVIGGVTGAVIGALTHFSPVTFAIGGAELGCHFGWKHGSKIGVGLTRLFKRRESQIFTVVNAIEAALK